MKVIENEEEYGHCRAWRDLFRENLEKVRAEPLPAPQPNQPYPDRLRAYHVGCLEEAIAALEQAIAVWEASKESSR